MVRKEVILGNQSLEIQSKSVFDSFNSVSLSLRILLITQDNSVYSDNVVQKTNTTLELSRH